MFQYKNDRLPHQFTRMLLEQKLLWVKDLARIGSEHGISWTDEAPTICKWSENRKNLLNALKLKYEESYLAKAAQTCKIYKKLDLTAGQRYFTETKRHDNITWVFKARSDLIELNANRFQVDRSKLCSLCNVNEEENIEHFIGRCQALKEFRIAYFKKPHLNEEQILEVLNGTRISFDALGNYIEICISYRKSLIAEFNF